MKIHVQRAKFSHEGTFLMSFAKTARDLGHTLVKDSASADLLLQWGARPRHGSPALYVELAWLPRWTYQVSHKGINANHHLARPKLDKLTRDQKWKVELILRHAYEGKGMPNDWGYMQRAEIDNAPSEPYILAPLQMASDVNMDSVPEGLRNNQSFIDHISELDLPFPVYFKQHPNSQAKQQMALKVRRRQDHIWRHKDGSVYQLLGAGTVTALVAGNSNCLHDCLIYDTPAIALGRGVWPRRIFGDALNLRYFEGFIADWNRDDWRKRRAQYVHWLSRVQWKLSDSADPKRVAAAIEGAM